MHWLIVPAALVVTLATALAITSLKAQADDARVTQTIFANVRAELAETSALEEEARANGRVGVEINERRQVLRTRLRGELDRLARIDGDHADEQARLRGLVAEYESAVDDVFSFVSRGDHERAVEVDDRRVDLAYSVVHRELAKHELEEGVQAAKTLQQSNVGTFLSLGAALIALLALFWRYHRTEQRRGREQAGTLEHEATHDYLTGLPNRRLLMDDLAQPGTRRLLAFFDLDGFKSYNDTFGHVEGDLLLQRLSRKLCARR